MRLIIAVAGAVLVAGCGGAAEEPAAGQVAMRFHAAVGSGDGVSACALLAPETRHELEQAERKPCAEAVLDQDLPQAGDATTSVFSGEAIARLDADTVFLAQFSAGWLVTAAGCTPRQDRPYDCQIKGA